MVAHLYDILLIILLTPFVGALFSGLLGKYLKVFGTNWITLPLVGTSMLLSMWVFWFFCVNNPSAYNVNLYSFALTDQLQFNIGFLVDRLTAFMMVIVTFVSFLVHVYSIGYMDGDSGYSRFFSYISGFTFAMLSLVMANNFLLLFFGWEGVGLFSYLLIGFWYERENANYASLKAFIANRVGDFGFLLGIAIVLTYFGSIDYATVFTAAPSMANTMVNGIFSGHINMLTLACLLLFLGAVGKSAQIPLHIWLEGSMEGPTPISALIHAATMVTAGVFMVARLSPMFEFSDLTLSVVMVIGALTCFLMGLLGIVQNDIKRVVAYSTLSQLGYMMAAQGASAYAVGMFHLMTHAAFKALLFLAAGSVIVAMHHEQDIRKMGGLVKKLPVTYVCMLIGSLALCGVPPFNGFFSKDLIIDAVKFATVPGHGLAYYLVLGGTLVTALYTFRMFFLVFHGKTRLDAESFSHVKESPWTILLPLIILAVPTLFSGALFFHADLNGFFGSSLFILPQHTAMATLLRFDGNEWQFFVSKLIDAPFLLGLSGIVLAYLLYVQFPRIPEVICQKCSWVYIFFVKKYFIDETYDLVFGGGARLLGMICYRVVDIFVIDRSIVGGLARSVVKLGASLRKLQTGLLYHYTLAMVLGLVVIFSLIWYSV